MKEFINMKEKSYVRLVIGLMSLLLLTACGIKADKTNPYISAPIEVIEDLNAEEDGLKTIDVREFISVTFTGLDTLGTAEMTVDFEGLAEEVFDGDYTASDVEDLADYYFSIYTQKAKNLSNGDILAVNVDEDLDIFDCRAKETELTYTVCGLEEMKAVDVFADLVITYDGIAPRGIASVDNPSTDLFIQSVTYEVSPSGYALNDGDIVTVRANYSEETARRYGCVAETLERQYTVEGLGYFIDYPEQINDECISFMVKEGLPVVKELINRDFKDVVRLLCPEGYPSYVSAGYSIAPTGNVYHFSPKDTGNRYTMMFFEISVDPSGADSSSDEYEELRSDKVYVGLVFENLHVYSDKTIDAYVPMAGVYSFSGLNSWSDFALSESEIYELYREAYRADHICYEPITFDTDVFLLNYLN